MIKLKNITKKYKSWNTESTIYNDLNFDIEPGDFITILWKSGSWKTTLLNLISGLNSFDSWEIEVNSKRLSEMWKDDLAKFRWENISFIFQSFHLIPNLTVRENIELPIDINKTKMRFSVEEILKKVWISEKIDSYPFELSGWQQQRVAIARAFISDTPILLADEPTWNIDEENAKIIMDLLLKLHKETKNTIVLITHEKSIANYADKIYKLENGKLKLTK